MDAVHDADPAGRAAEPPAGRIEAARVDGASDWQIFRYLTLPHLRRYLELAGLLGSIYIVQNFDAVFTITSGGLGTANLPYTIYQTFYTAHDYGLASAAGVVVVIGTIIIATFALRTVSRLFRGGVRDEHHRPATRPPGSTPRRRPAGRPRPTASRARCALLGLLAWVVGHRSSSCPSLWMLLTSFHSETDAATNPPSLFAPLTLDGYREFFGARPEPLAA